MAIATVPAVVTIPTEGSPTFRTDATSAWNELKNFSVALKDTTIPQMNASIQSVNQNALQVSIDKTTTLTAKDTAVSAKDEAVLAKNEAVSAKEIIESYGITSETASTLTEINDEINGFNTRVTDIEKSVMRAKMKSFGLGL